MVCLVIASLTVYLIFFFDGSILIPEKFHHTNKITGAAHIHRIGNGWYRRFGLVVTASQIFGHSIIHITGCNKMLYG